MRRLAVITSRKFGSARRVILSVLALLLAMIVQATAAMMATSDLPVIIGLGPDRVVDDT